MITRLLHQLRCRLAAWILTQSSDKRYAFARRIAPDTTALIRHRPRRPPPFRLPPRSHLIYHQNNVDPLAAQNSLASLASQIPKEDEILFLDMVPTASISWLEPFRDHAWFSYTACRGDHPEQRSYTHGLNNTLPGLKAPWLFVWRTDYVYPAGVMDAYMHHLDNSDFASPYRVWVGKPAVDSSFVHNHRNRITPFDFNFWAEHSDVCSLYETQDPALFAIRRELWNEIGGLNHELWGYGWQFAEFAARIRAARPAHRIAYFDCPPPLHQTHGGSLMHAGGVAPEANTGRQRFARFLGGAAALDSYLLKQHLRPRPPE